MKNNLLKYHKKEDLTPAFRRAFESLKASLPAEISDRLTCSRAARNHGSYRTLYLFNVWDVNQNDVLHRNHFCYCIGYDPLRIWAKRGDWYLQAWLNTTRPALNREEIRQVIQMDVKKACPRPFQYRDIGRAVECIYEFDFSDSLSAFDSFVGPHYSKLVAAIHPVLIPIIDACSTRLTKEERHHAILGRVKEHYTYKPGIGRELVREYTRAIPKGWRQKLLQKCSWRCAQCDCDLRNAEVHIDHVVPFSRGGMTVIENLQPLCATCNLKKGNRCEQLE